MESKLIDFNIKGDEKGYLIAFEENHNVPFDIKRTFYIFDTKNNVARGKHANKNTKHLLIVISGSCMVKLDNGFEQAEVLLNRPDKGLFIDNMVWKEMYNFSYNCILLVLASEYYDESEYIRDYESFKELVGVNKLTSI